MIDRGSSWRRWDLHVHTPESALANHYGDWDSYIDALETKGGAVSVLGVTDYFSIEGYKKVLNASHTGRLAGFDFILPNIEFRTSPELPNGRGINIHILVNPAAKDHVENVERCLGLLTFRYNEVYYPCRTADLRALGRAVNPSQTDDFGAFKTGVNAFKPGFDTFQNWLETKGRWMTDNGLVVLANGKDGPSGLSKDAGFAATREELYRCAAMIFSGNPKDRAYFLGKGTDDVSTVISKHGSLKPCIHGSDAHDENKLFQPDNDRYCWIKADPTFEGLRQIIHEPEDRVSIGRTAPSPYDISKVIDSVRFEGGHAWFCDREINLNHGLVAIIGEKGSGKTALAELIAFATSSWKSQGMPASFITKASPTIDDLTVTVTWLDGHKSSRKISEGPATALPEVRYLSQDFVEELCSRDVFAGQLIREIEDVVFGYIPESKRLDASDFAGLRRLKTDHIARRKRAVTAAIASLNREIIDIENRIAGRSEKQQFLDRALLDGTSIDAQLPALQSTIDLAVASEINAINQIYSVKIAELSRARRAIFELTKILTKARDFIASINQNFDELRPELIAVGLTEHEVEAFRPKTTIEATLPLDRLAREMDKTVSDLAGDPNVADPNGVTISDLDSKLEELRARVAKDEQEGKRLAQLLRQRARIDGDIRRIRSEIEYIDETVSRGLEERKEKRWIEYLSYFDLIEEERIALAALYAPLELVVAEDSSGTKAGFELNVHLDAEPYNWVQQGRDMFDKRRSGIAIDQPEMVKELGQTLFRHWGSADQANIRHSMEKLIDAIGSPQIISQQLSSWASRESVYDWLFSTDHIKLSYGLKYNGIDLERLSPGTRGIVLLVLYLAMDRQDRRPLVVDQPEGNLDNSSVYEALVPFLRQAKHTRQVILVSHNPNLVVTTDADQVLVAFTERLAGSLHPTISYAGGALENAGTEKAIRTQAIRLLEGGPDPFKMRERKYAIHRT